MVERLWAATAPQAGAVTDARVTARCTSAAEASRTSPNRSPLYLSNTIIVSSAAPFTVTGRTLIGYTQ
jgi:hypothetical protein